MSNNFGFNALRSIASNNAGNNTVFSGASVEMCAALAHAGASGMTAQAFVDVFGFDANTAQKHLRIGQAINVANSVWFNQGIALQSYYERFVVSMYNALCRKVDFCNPSTASEINAWVNSSTLGQISQIVTPDMLSGVDMALINALAFKSKWVTMFDEDMTSDEDFALATGSVIKVPTMYVDDKFDYAEVDGVKLVSLPLQDNGLRMVFVLPPSLPQLVDSLSDELLSGWLGAMRRSKVTVMMPKFDVTSDIELNGILQQMGLGIAFGSDADFSEISTTHLEISRVIQKAKIKIDEVGAEAAAVTAMFATRGIHTEPKYRFIADRPFGAFVLTAQNDVLFSALINNPA